MSSTVNSAFEEFLSKEVRLTPDQTEKARRSRDNLFSNINSFSEQDDFFNIVKNGHIQFGSFARKTKIKPLDDIDLMICISGDGRTYLNNGDTYYITGLECDYTNELVSNSYINSTKVINRFIKKLRDLSDYDKAEMHKNKEAATLKMKSYTWNYDIVPCWHMDIDKYLIPDGSGNWKLTDPRIDNMRTSDINQKHKGKLLDIIRLMKYWNKRAVTYTMDSYFLECMILNVYEGINSKNNYSIDYEFGNLLKHLSVKVLGDVYDPKNIQGNINNYSMSERKTISTALSNAYSKAEEAFLLKLIDKNHENAIKKWREVFGSSFPSFSY